MTLHKALTLLPLTAVLALAGCGGGDGGESAEQPKRSGASPSREARVTIQTFNFQPDPIRIRAGQTIEWTNQDSTVHTVTTGARGKPDGKLDERLDAGGGTVRQRFERPGRYPYHCTIHSGPGMEAEVIVE